MRIALCINLIIAVIGLYPFSSSYSQTSYYEVVVRKRTLGTLTVSRISKEDDVNYYVLGKSEIRLFFIQYKVRYGLLIYFKKDQLIWSDFKIIVNNKIRSSSVTAWKGDHYEINIDGEKSRIDEPIYHTCAEVYFEKPDGIFELYSEITGFYQKLRCYSPELFILTNTKTDNLNYFLYENDKHIKTIVPHPIVDFLFIRVDSFIHK